MKVRRRNTVALHRDFTVLRSHTYPLVTVLLQQCDYGCSLRAWKFGAEHLTPAVATPMRNQENVPNTVSLKKSKPPIDRFHSTLCERIDGDCQVNRSPR